MQMFNGLSEIEINNFYINTRFVNLDQHKIPNDFPG